MPIYAYRCATCGHAKDVLQKLSDPLLTVCPSCGAETFHKQVTAAGFQLKGSGWYVTDFRGGPPPAGGSEGGKADAAKTSPGESPSKAGGEAAAPAAAPAKSDATPAPSPSPAPAASGSAPSAQ